MLQLWQNRPCLDTSIQRKYKIISGSNTTCEHELDIFVYDQKLLEFTVQTACDMFPGSTGQAANYSIICT